jgi:hypothetical protein
LNWPQALLDSLAFLLGGLGAALAGVLTQLAIERNRSGGLMRALRAEVTENLARIGQTDDPNRTPGSVERTAWDAARALPISQQRFDLLAAAYAAGAELNNRIAICDRNLSSGGAIDFSSAPGHQAALHQRALGDAAMKAGVLAKAAFKKADQELSRSL